MDEHGKMHAAPHRIVVVLVLRKALVCACTLLERVGVALVLNVQVLHVLLAGWLDGALQHADGPRGLQAASSRGGGGGKHYSCHHTRGRGHEACLPQDGGRNFNLGGLQSRACAEGRWASSIQHAWHGMCGWQASPNACRTACAQLPADALSDCHSCHLTVVSPADSLLHSSSRASDGLEEGPAQTLPVSNTAR